jgi:isoleucyl-tRNA synthetase
MSVADVLGNDAPELNDYVKNRDTLDVWFDSGTTFATVLQHTHKQQSQFPADMYLEGTDQHRGWFHTSLLAASMVHGGAPYKSLLTHGFTVDGQGRKMSKSMGNVVAPQKVYDSLGADILRLWIGATDYSGELRVSDEILKRVVESYRRIRNTVRFLLANIADFDLHTHAVPTAELLEIDRYALLLTEQLRSDCAQAYAQYQFQTVTQKLQIFCSEDLGAFYLDILKDRLYTTAAQSLERRSAQTTLHIIAQTLLKLLAPIISFTAEEAWKFLRINESVFFSTWETKLFDAPDLQALQSRWAVLREVRAEVTKVLELLRSEGKIGSALQAHIHIAAPVATLHVLNSCADDLKYIMMTSSFQLEVAERLTITAEISRGTKCERCWHVRPEVGQDPARPGLCGRCIANLYADGERRAIA